MNKYLCPICEGTSFSEFADEYCARCQIGWEQLNPCFECDDSNWCPPDCDPEAIRERIIAHHRKQLKEIV